MILQLNPPLPVTTPKGKALAHAIIDTGIENEIQWVCFQDKTGECWTWRNPDIRAQKNITHGREHITPFYSPDSVAFIEKEYNDQDENEDEEDQQEEVDRLTDEVTELRDRVLNLKQELVSTERENRRILLECSEKCDEVNGQLKENLFSCQELLLGFMRKKNFDDSDFANMFGFLVNSGMCTNDIKTLTGMEFNRP